MMPDIALSGKKVVILSRKAIEHTGGENMNVFSGTCVLVVTMTLGLSADMPEFPVGMNLPSLNYYTEALLFNDVMTTASAWITYHEGGGWNTGNRDSLDLDTNGYPLEIPQTVDGKETRVRFLINNHYQGRYVFQSEGDGDFRFNVPHEIVGGVYYLDLDGTGGHRWIQITRSARGNHIRNIHILPEELANSYEPTNPRHLFNEAYIRGLRQFHAIRFMDWLHTNNSRQKYWADRPTPTSYTQGGKNGICIEYAIRLCNYLDMDGWFNVPHAATNEYIRKFAEMVESDLEQGRTAYVEYSNEVWNWQFDQAQWACRAGRWGPERLQSDDEVYNLVRNATDNTSDDCVDHPERDAALMARTFRTWKEVFRQNDRADDLVRVAAVQVGWCANTSRILSYLKEHGGADAVAPTAYFNYTKEDHEQWNAMNASDVTPEMILDAVSSRMDSPEFYECVQRTADQAIEFGMDIVIYEAGQHMQPWNQGEWEYNQAVWDAQRHAGMYDLYLKHWGHCDSIYQEAGGIRLNCAFSYMGKRESRWGSWGHLESIAQLDSLDRIRNIAPKYAALVDMNSKRTGASRRTAPFAAGKVNDGSSLVGVVVSEIAGGALVRFDVSAPAVVWMYDAAGRVVAGGTYSAAGRYALKIPEGLSGTFFLTCSASGREFSRKVLVP